jgi:hydroxymethylpyrimidine/phosphomethylpyrimidine kinase
MRNGVEYDERGGRWPTALTIAGSDSGGGAGIQADLKTFSAMKVYGMSAITAVTAQSTVGVAGAYSVPAAAVAAQIDAVLEDIGADAVKTGMLMTAETVEVVADRLSAHKARRLVVDPVMVAKSGDTLLEEDALALLIRLLLPLALVVTPNVPEAERLSGVKIASREDVVRAAGIIQEAGSRNVVVKGGHLEEDADPCDLLLTEDGSKILLCSERIRTKSDHGTGCTFSAAFTAALAMGSALEEAFERAKSFVSEALKGALPLGRGHGPVDHLWPFRG